MGISCDLGAPKDRTAQTMSLTWSTKRRKNIVNMGHLTCDASKVTLGCAMKRPEFTLGRKIADTLLVCPKFGHSTDIQRQGMHAHVQITQSPLNCAVAGQSPHRGQFRCADLDGKVTFP